MIRFITALIVAFSAFAAQAAVDVNKANQADLETLRGVGPSLSGKIINARKSGEFKNWNDLVDRVSGIGAASAAKLSKVGLTVGGAPYVADVSTHTKAERPHKAAKASAEHPAKAASAKESR